MKPQLDLACVVTLLKSSIKDAVAALNDLLVAVGDSVEGQVRGSDALLKQLAEICGSFKEDWRNFNPILRQCRGYADDYVDFCNHSCAHSPAESVVYASKLHATAKKLWEDIQDVKTKHGKKSVVLQGHMGSLLFIFDQTITARSKRSEWIRSRLGRWTAHR